MIVLVRHGQSVANAESLLVGRADSPLTELGRRQAEATGTALARSAAQSGREPSRILTSPLARARDTAEAIAACHRATLGSSPQVEVEERLIELDYGELDLQPLREVAAATWTEWRYDRAFRPPGGESLVELAERVQALLASIEQEAARSEVIAVSHVSPVKAAAAWAMGVGIEVSWRLSLPVASITRVAVGGTVPALVSFGETAHLDVLWRPEPGAALG